MGRNTLMNDDQKTSLEFIKWAARREFEQEEFRNAVEREKERIRAHRAMPWWKRVFPWRIRIETVKG